LSNPALNTTDRPPDLTETTAFKMSSTAQQAGVKLEGIKQKVEAAAPKKLSGIDLYSRFAFAGAVCCSVTHGGLTPVDVYVPVSSPLQPPILTSLQSKPASNSTQLPITVA
jgi:solute carrier family 25 phosphate transporter 3